MKRMISLLLALMMILSLCACGGKTEESKAPESSGGSSAAPADKEVTLTLAHIRPEGSPADVAIKAFCDEVAEKTNGTVKFEIYPASQMGDYTTVFERVMVGDVDMQFATVPSSVDKFFGIGNAPAVAATWAEAKMVYGTGSELQGIFTEKLAGYGIKDLCMYPLYFGGIALGVDPVDPTNPDAKNGIKIRVPSMLSFERYATELGYLGTPLPSSETFTSMQTGVVDGAIGMGAEGYYSNLADLVKYFLPINDHFETWHLIINMDKFDSLSDAQKAALEEAAVNLENNRWEVAEAETDEYIQKLKDKGATIVEFTDEELTAIANKIRANVWPLLGAEYGEAEWELVTSSVSK